ncbi:uncharacterized protein N7515_004385 [Penicillium bovifimosum]|uniref:Uncharacterized protein n=1 Tax=Penicillium bovifimosum TaxID=126998 RepID=A0A9W9L3V1_9EURO|nr:uncharacterized protein N7515_004385 [Penicillium bovifimosum]KAJ5135107.1 hypothetical protein N7515_004385 [Penicillium bovifimosum]
MWPKHPFHKPKRLSISNPIVDHNPLTELPVNSLNLRDKYLLGPNDAPSLQSGPIRPDNKTRRYSEISAISPDVESHRRGSRSSFCVSPIDGEQIAPYAENLRPLTSPAPDHKTANHQNGQSPHQSQLQPVQPPPERQFISGKSTDWEGVSREQDKPRATSSHKRTVSTTSNLINWRQQFNPRKQFNAARSRISSFSKTEDHQGNRDRSSSRVHPMEEHSSKDKRAPDAIPKLDPFGFTPSSVTTTITAGGPVTPPPRPATEHAPSRAQENMPVLNFDNSNMMFASDDYEPRSRFSATTYTATEPDSQNASRRESMQFETRSTDDVSTSSIMDRRRPVPSGMVISKKQPSTAKPVRKPTPSQVAEQVAQMPEGSSTPEPPLDTQGRIKAMEAKRDELSQRRFTLETIMDELYKATRPGAVDAAARAEMMKALASMDVELADIRKEQHELGVGLTRAYKRLDEKQNAGDGNNLWVKRVTS